MKSWKQFNTWFCCGLLGLVWTVIPVVQAYSKTVDRIVAKVNEKIITQSELEERTAVKMMSLQKANIQPMPSQKKVMSEELKHMIEERLLIDAGRKLGLKVDETSVTKAVDEIKRTNGLSEGDLEKMLQLEFKSLEEYKNKIRNQILISRVIGFEVRKRATVENGDIEEYYNKHLKDYWVNAKLKLRHILFLMDDTLLEKERRIKNQKARLALKKIQSGGDFIAVAKEFSEDISASTGGDLGEIERGKMVPEFEKAAFLLKEGEVSGLVETPYGLHIIKVDKVFPGETLPLDKVRTQIENKLKDKKLKVEYEKYILELTQKAFIENKISPSSQPVVGSAKKTIPVKSLRPPPHRGEVLADIPPPKKKMDSSQKLTQKQKFSRFQAYEEKLRHYKKLRNNNKISVGEYQSKKQELLSQF
jgi:peptidyl-prolyl cis-trans isomerase SurA